jgi:hypothetical protein
MVLLYSKGTGFTGCGKVGMGPESKTSGAKAHDDYIAFTPGINPRPTLKPEFLRSLLSLYPSLKPVTFNRGRDCSETEGSSSTC